MSDGIGRRSVLFGSAALVGCSSGLRDARGRAAVPAGNFPRHTRRSSRRSTLAAIPPSTTTSASYSIGSSGMRTPPRASGKQPRSSPQAAELLQPRQHLRPRLPRRPPRRTSRCDWRSRPTRRRCACSRGIQRPNGTWSWRFRRRGEDRESGGSSGRGRSADYGQGNMNVPGYEGNPEAAVGAMAGGGMAREKESRPRS